MDSLLGEMTLDEKLAQLGSVWVGAQLGSGNVAPMQEAFVDPPCERTRVTFALHAERTSFTGVDLRRIVEPGEIRVMVGASSEDTRGEGAFRLTGDPRVVGHERVLTTPVRLG